MRTRTASLPSRRRPIAPFIAVSASALLSCAAAWLAQYGPAHRPATAAPAPAMVVRAEAPAAVIRMR
ncbi:MAG: hypothetical protein FD180_3258, partial [Planctomycetota bacterium]